MSTSNRPTLQSSVIVALATLAFSAVSNAQVKPVTLQPATVSTNSVVIPEEKQFNQRLLLRYTELWNMYRFRNEVTMTKDEKEKVDALIASVQAPTLHAEMRGEEIRKALSANAVELTKRLKLEAAGKVTSDHATANLAYLQGTLLKGMANPKTYAMSSKKFRDEFLSVLPADPTLPDSITQRLTQTDSKPAASATVH